MLTQAESLPQSPEDLLRHLECETLRQKALREGRERQRLAALGAGLVFVVGSAMAALFFLFSMLCDLPHGAKEKPGPSESTPMSKTAPHPERA